MNDATRATSNGGHASSQRALRPARRTRKAPIAQRRTPLGTKEKIGLILGAIAFAFPLLVDIPNLEPLGERMLAIFLLAIIFWITEPIPLTATAVLVIMLEVLFVAKGGVFAPALPDPALPDPAAADDGALADQLLPASSYFAALANPVIILFLGGFMIAHGAEKYGLDRNLASVMLKPFSDSARATTAGLMLITAILSMFMSNTATTATMFAVVVPILKALPKGKARAGVALSIPLAANVGGIGTPVGTPPNAIAIGALAERGITISFVDWMIMAVPFMLIILLFSWLFLSLVFLPKDARIHVEMTSNWDRTTNARIFYVIAGITILAWMTEPLHGISSNTVGFFPVVALLCLKVMGGADIKALDWPVLWLVSGGIALGTGVGATGLDAWLVGSVPWESLGGVWIVAILGLIGFGMANVISHSAAANLLVPLAVSLAVSLDGVDTLTVSVVVAIACSLGMSMPISTPPNAIAYSTGEIKISQMALLGMVVGTAATAVLIFALPSLWSAIGLA
ncbi:MAG: DASS family sodium-coupled anion symporter [Trueperella sp.]|uniref:SLC13 family permease n=1 Tax=Trueperella sp. TaxID=2699835 RepID=UPI0025FEF0FA|nr:DASS family sodium-coupled anion symporter [Trueperella sp.]MCI7305071.1 DASS family sodium-coupled anion symporter [Trueperella sp.]